MNHGTATAYKKGCRCRTCRQWCYRDNKRRRMYGIVTTDAEPVRQHLLAMYAHGWTRAAIQRAYGVETSYQRHITNGQERMNPERAALILSMPLLPTTAKQPPAPLGCRRRLQALAAIGWPQHIIATQVGTTQAHISRIVHGSCQPRAALAARIAATYDSLHLTNGPSPHSIICAQRNTWHPPLAWDNIDDPDETPAISFDTGRNTPTHVILDMIAEGMSYRDIAAITDVQPNSIARRVARHKKATT